MPPDFTSERARFLERLDVQEGYGRTALHDAVAATPRLVDEKAQGRKAVLLITDGVDNASRLTAEQAIVAARKVQVPIYTVGISSIPANMRQKGQTGQNEALMRRFSEDTGGSLFVVHDPDELKESVARVNQELRYQYLIAYQPSHAAWDGRFRSIRLETRNDRYVVRTRKGYYANPSPGTSIRSEPGKDGTVKSTRLFAVPHPVSPRRGFRCPNSKGR